jgi:Uncharacterized protein involved in stress response
MAASLQKGQKFDLTKGNPNLRRIIAGLGWKKSSFSPGENYDFDVSAFLTGFDGRVRSSRDLVYYGNPLHESHSVEHSGDSLKGGSGGDDEQLKIDLTAVPPDVERITVAVTIYDPENRGQNFGQVSSAYIRLVDRDTGTELIRYDLGEDYSAETAIVVGEIYRYKGEWKFNAVGSGFTGGLKKLCEHFGVDTEIKDRRFGAVILEKGRKVNLVKNDGQTDKIHINLNWSNPPYPGKGIDLDLGCFYELTNGKRGCVQALGKAFGSLNQPPYILLDRDDRTGTSADGENLLINGSMLGQIRRVLVYTYIYGGAADWRQADGVVTVKAPGNRDIIVRMDEYGSTKTMCAIAMIESKPDGGCSIEKIVRFFTGHREMDQTFQWGLRWVTGHK